MRYAASLPGNLLDLPRAGICASSTPLEPLSPPSGALGLRALRVKRDDLTSPFYGGNKVRKLDFLLGAALAEGRKSVITFGAYGSNHALATAVHAKRLGLEPHVILSPQVAGPFAARTLRAHAGLGTRLHPIEGWDGQPLALRLAQELKRRDGIAPGLIPVGGSDALGTLGYVAAAFELMEQLQTQRAPWPDAIYVPAGSLGTVVGLAVGLALAESPSKVVGIRVTPEVMSNDTVAARMAGEVLDLLKVEHGLGWNELRLELRSDWFEPGYGIVTPETTAAVREGEAQGLSLETTYTGKAFAALLADARAGRLEDQQVLFWNTYNSAPYPGAGPDESLPEVLRAYVQDCDLRFGA